MIVYQFYLNGRRGYVVPQMEISTFLAELSEIDIGDVLTIQPIEMTKDAFEKLPEFQGW